MNRPITITMITSRINAPSPIKMKAVFSSSSSLETSVAKFTPLS